MIWFVARRLVASVAILVAVASFSFFLLHAAPGSPFDTETRRSAEVTRAMEERYCVRCPLLEQYGHMLARLAHGDLGISIKKDTSVNALIAEHGPISAVLGAMALVVALVLGVALGVIAAARRNTWVDHALMIAAVVGISIPAFVLGPLLIAEVSLALGWLPPARIDGARSLILPAITLGVFYVGAIARLARGGMLDALDHDFVRTARAKGLSERAVVWKHALRVGITPVVTYLGPATATLISGSFIVEKIFQIPGLGTYFINSVFDRDTPVVIGVFVFYAALLVTLNLVVDLLYGVLDPRVRERGGRAGASLERAGRE